MILYSCIKAPYYCNELDPWDSTICRTCDSNHELANYFTECYLMDCSIMDLENDYCDHCNDSIFNFINKTTIKLSKFKIRLFL